MYSTICFDVAPRSKSPLLSIGEQIENINLAALRIASVGLTCADVHDNIKATFRKPIAWKPSYFMITRRGV